jgi:hypothetical protein
MRWFKFYLEALFDENSQIRKFSDEEVGQFCKFLALAGLLGSGGRFEINGSGFQIEQICEMAKVGETGSRTFKKLVAIDTIRDQEGVFSFPNWKIYQDDWERKNFRKNQEKYKSGLKVRSKSTD